MRPFIAFSPRSTGLPLPPASRREKFHSKKVIFKKIPHLCDSTFTLDSSGRGRDGTLVEQLGSIRLRVVAPVHLFQGIRELPEGTAGFLRSLGLVSLSRIIPEHLGKLEAVDSGFAVHQNPGGGGGGRI